MVLIWLVVATVLLDVLLLDAGVLPLPEKRTPNVVSALRRGCADTSTIVVDTTIPPLASLHISPCPPTRASRWSLSVDLIHDSFLNRGFHLFSSSEKVGLETQTHTAIWDQMTTMSE